MIRINHMINLSEVLRMLQLSYKTVIDLSDSKDYTAYYRQYRLFFPKVCPVCKRHDCFTTTVIKVISCINNKHRVYVTPVCKECANKLRDESDMDHTTKFYVQRYFLCSCPRD